MNEAAQIRYPGFRWLIMLSGCISFLALQVNMISFAPVLGEIAKSLNVDMGKATQLMAVFVFSGAVALMIGGVLCDKYGILTVIILGNICGSLPALLMPWIGFTFPAVLAARIVEGLAVGFCMCTMAPIMAVWFAPKERGIVAGILGTSVALGAMVGVFSGPAVFVATGSWQQMSAWLSGIGWVALVFAVVLAVIPKPEPPSQPEGKEAQGGDGTAFKKALSTGVTWIGVLVTFFAAWAMQASYNIVPGYFAAAAPVGIGFGPMLSGKIMLAVTVAAILAPVVAGILQDKVFKGNAKPLMYAGFFLSCAFACSILCNIVFSSMGLLITCLVLLGAGIAIVYPAITVYIARAYPVQIVGKMMGLWMGLGAFGGAAGLAAGGVAIAAMGNYVVAIALIGVASAMGFVFVLSLRRSE